MPRKKEKRKIGVVDFETEGFKHGRIPKPLCCEYFDEDGVHQVFEGEGCGDKMAQFVAGEKADVFAHNGGKFDFFYMLPHAEPKLKIINSRIAKMEIGDAKLFDSFLILPIPLKATGQKKEIDYSIFEIDTWRDYRADILDYLHGDCVALLDWVKRFREEFGNGLTLAGTAFRQMKEIGIDIETTSEQYDDIFRKFYFGGRVQAIETGVFTGPLKMYDIDSAYPEAMMHDHPKGSAIRVSKKLPDYAGGWFAVIEAVSYGCLPFPGDEKLEYPDDETPRTYFATGWEIIAGLETKTLKILNVREVIMHSSYRNFAPYVQKFHGMKTAAQINDDLETRTLAKLFLNSPYGKFGTDPRRFKDYELHLRQYGPASEAWEHVTDISRYKALYEKPADAKIFYNTATAASVTGYVRAKLWRALCRADRPLYNDTDSIICRGGVETGDGLGAWGLEETFSKVHIGGRKIYVGTRETEHPKKGRYKVASKGFKAEARDIAQAIENGSYIDYESISPALNILKGGIDVDPAKAFVKRHVKMQPPQKHLNIGKIFT